MRMLMAVAVLVPVGVVVVMQAGPSGICPDREAAPPGGADHDEP